jgi:class 3 adenylate cyclase
VGFGYGSLASGADVIVAEALLARGAELHITLPFERDEFVAVSVADSGPEWVTRFETCLAAASSVTFATEGAYLDEPCVFSHCANVAMGDAVLRARNLDAEVEQLAIWDGRVAVNEAGTAVDVATWRRTGRPATVLDSRSDLLEEPAAEPAGSQVDRREVRAMLFADVSGYSGLSDAQIPAFVDHLLGPLGATMHRFTGDIRYLNTWGDAIFAVLDSVVVAAECALALQATMRGLDLGATGLPDTLALRIGVHAGPTLSRADPIRGGANFYGDAVTRAARIEPRTPAGAVYVTHPFAALVALEAPADLACQYVGRLPTAKAYGTFPMYLLTNVNTET